MAKRYGDGNQNHNRLLHSQVIYFQSKIALESCQLKYYFANQIRSLCINGKCFFQSY